MQRFRQVSRWLLFCVLAGCGSLKTPEYLRARPLFTTFDPGGTWLEGGDSGTTITFKPCTPERPDSGFYYLKRMTPGKPVQGGSAIIDGNVVYMTLAAELVVLDPRGQKPAQELDGLIANTHYYSSGQPLYTHFTSQSRTSDFSGKWDVREQRMDEGYDRAGEVQIDQLNGAFKLAWEFSKHSYVGSGFVYNGKLVVGRHEPFLASTTTYSTFSVTTDTAVTGSTEVRGYTWDGSRLVGTSLAQSVVGRESTGSQLGAMTLTRVGASH